MAQSVKEKVDGLKTECSAIAKSTSKEGYTYINAKTKRYSLNNDYAIIDVADIAKGSKVNNIVIDASNVKGVILNTEGVTFGNAANPNQKVPNNWELKMNEPNAVSATGSSSEGSAGTGSGSTSTITTGNLRLVE